MKKRTLPVLLLFGLTVVGFAFYSFWLPEKSAPEGGGSSSAPESSAAAPAGTEPGGEEQWALVLVNGSHPLPEDFLPDVTAVAHYPDRKFDCRAVGALNALLADAEKAGHPLYLVSTYRSVSYQKGLFTRKTNFYKNKGFSQPEAEKQAALWVARPGCSEHNLALAADIVSKNWYSSHSDLTGDFANTPEFKWLFENCASYGFILRYPEGRSEVTGVEYEPWHYRYVGKKAAAEIMSQNTTLEEYTAHL